MGTTSWQRSGDDLATCSCDYLYTCLRTNLVAQAPQGHRKFVLACHRAQGRYGDLTLDARLRLAQVTASHLRASGLDWEVSSRQNTAHSAAFQGHS
jgi:hypothetical protein